MNSKLTIKEMRDKGIKPYNTEVWEDTDGLASCWFYSTQVVSINKRTVTLNTGGYHSPTTFDRMSSFLSAYGLPGLKAGSNGVYLMGTRVDAWGMSAELTFNLDEVIEVAKEGGIL